jgi:hypothetical protein
MTNPDIASWRKATCSGAEGKCLEVALVGDVVALRNSNRPGDGTVVFPRSAVAAWIAGIKAGELDDVLD